MYAGFLLKNFFEMAEILPALPPPVTSILRQSSLNPGDKKERQHLSAESFLERAEWCRTMKGAGVTLVCLSFSSSGFLFLLIFHYLREIWCSLTSSFTCFKRWLTIVVCELSHQGWNRLYFSWDKILISTVKIINTLWHEYFTDVTLKTWHKNNFLTFLNFILIIIRMINLT